MERHSNKPLSTVTLLISQAKKRQSFWILPPYVPFSAQPWDYFREQKEIKYHCIYTHTHTHIRTYILVWQYFDNMILLLYPLTSPHLSSNFRYSVFFRIVHCFLPVPFIHSWVCGCLLPQKQKRVLLEIELVHLFIPKSEYYSAFIKTRFLSVALAVLQLTM